MEASSPRKLVILNCDFLGPMSMFDRFFGASKADAVLVDPRRAREEEAMKVEISHGRVLQFGKSIPLEKSAGEYMGLATFHPDNIPALHATVRGLTAAKRTDEWYEASFSEVSSEITIEPITITEGSWVEIDDLDDYREARRLADEGALG
jgi:choline kinase